MSEMISKYNKQMKSLDTSLEYIYLSHNNNGNHSNVISIRYQFYINEYVRQFINANQAIFKAKIRLIFLYIVFFGRKKFSLGLYNHRILW